jgi:hypothetical protein
MYSITPQTQRLIDMGLLPAQTPREKQLNRFGVMIWDHKTGGHCQVLNGSSWSNTKKYYVPRKGYGSVLKSITG